MFYSSLHQYIASAVKQFDRIPPGRQAALMALTRYIQSRVDAGQAVNLIFICTHNSRRSHMAQLWAQAAAYYYEIPGIRTFSGGTEATAFNPRAVAAMVRAGFRIEKSTEDANPVYTVYSGDRLNPVQAFSKRYEAPPNPQRDFCAVMTCSEADRNCPAVAGTDCRVAMPYDDPKAFDGTPQETAQYDARCRQICREIFRVFSQVNVTKGA